MTIANTQQRPLLITLEQLHSTFNAPFPIDAGEAWSRLAKFGAIEAFTPPAINEYWPGQGGVYAGQVREDDGSTYHEILAEVRSPSRLNHGDATKWAASLTIDGHSDFTLPTRRGAALLYANLSHLFEKTWHWTSTLAGLSHAWNCHFNDGHQSYDVKSYAGCARAVRRFKA